MYLLNTTLSVIGLISQRNNTIYSKMRFDSCKYRHRQPKINIREPLNYKDLYGNAMDLCKMVETNIVLSIKSTYPAASSIICHLPSFQADSKRFRRVSVIRVSTAK